MNCRNKCPWCGNKVRGPWRKKVALVASCNKCDGMMFIFEGSFFQLGRQLVLNSTPEDLWWYITETIRQELGQDLEIQTPEDVVMATNEENPFKKIRRNQSNPPPNRPPQPISKGEADHFAQVELPLLDNPAAFKSIFGPKKGGGKR